MLSRKTNRPAKRIILTSLLTLMSGCANSAAIENLISADPDLKKETTTEVSNRVKSKSSEDSTSVPDRDSVNTTKIKTNSSDKPKDDAEAQDRVRDDRNEKTKSSQEDNDSNLLIDFPDRFPVYPQAELQEVESSEDKRSGKLIWQTMDNRQAVADFYLAELLANDWDVIKPFTIDPKRKVARAIAVKEELRVELSLIQKAENKNSKQGGTKLAVVYHPLDEEIPPSSISRVEETTTSKRSEQAKSIDPEDSENQGKVQKDKISSLESTEQKNPNQTKPESAPNNNSYRSADTDFADLDEVPPQLQQPIKSVAALSILTPYTGKSNVELTKFAPNEIITRGEYARWLIAANNRYYDDNPGKKIYVPAKTSQPAFQDVKANHPDFAAIQSLAEAGLIPSRLTEDSTNLLFKPDAPLTREDLVSWKVPLDTRQSLPKASIEAIEESWGFRDAAKIDSLAVRALYADFQNGDRANVRRMFGYTALFQPLKPVTRAEAAASLWYFGFQGDGITAKEVLKSAAETES